MQDIKEFYILGLPIETEIGNCQFIKVKEYPDCFNDLQIISLSKSHLIYKYSQLNKGGLLNDFIKELEKLTLYEIAVNIPELQESYYKVFTKVFGSEETLDFVNQDNFDYYRKLIMTMNCLKEEKINPNPEIQRALERSRRVKAMESEKFTFADMCSSVVGHNGLTYQSINEFTIYQLYITYYRIAQIKNYDTTTLFKTVSNDVKVDSWSKHINLFEEENHFVDYKKFKKQTGSVFEE